MSFFFFFLETQTSSRNEYYVCFAGEIIHICRRERRGTMRSRLFHKTYTIRAGKRRLYISVMIIIICLYFEQNGIDATVKTHRLITPNGQPKYVEIATVVDVQRIHIISINK